MKRKRLYSATYRTKDGTGQFFDVKASSHEEAERLIRAKLPPCDFVLCYIQNEPTPLFISERQKEFVLDSLFYSSLILLGFTLAQCLSSL